MSVVASSVGVMSSSSRLHISALHAALDDVLAVDPIYLTTAEKQAALRMLPQVIARAEAAMLRVLAVADDIAVETGARSTAAWLADQTRQAHGTVRRHSALAGALTSRWFQMSDALAAGEVNLAQAHVIVDALDALPQDLGDDLRAKAEAYLIEQASEFGPRELRVLGGGVLAHLAPEISDEVDYQRLLAEERRAGAATRLSMRPRGDGSTDIHARVPDHAANRLGAYLNAYTAPRRHHLHPHHDNTVETPFGPLAPAETDQVAQLPITRQRGQAFVALLENIPTTSLPRHGGTATTVTITLDYATLVRGVDDAGVASTSTGDRITAGTARRLACQAGIIPVVLGGDSEILDVGRTSRLVTDAIRKALNLRDQGCTTVGCTMPAEFCEGHHIVPWSTGGKTSLEDCKLLCSFHHHRAHDPGWSTHHQPNGKTRFTRRT